MAAANTTPDKWSPEQLQHAITERNKYNPHDVDAVKEAWVCITSLPTNEPSADEKGTGGGVFIEVGYDWWWGESLTSTDFYQQQLSHFANAGMGPKGHWYHDGKKQAMFEATVTRDSDQAPGGPRRLSTKLTLVGKDGQTGVNKTYEYIPPLRHSLQSTIEKNILNGSVSFWGLSPKYRKPEYLYQVTGELRFVVTTAPAFKYSYEFDIYVGRPGAMIKQEGPVKVSRMRDGGTTRATWNDDKNVFYSPSPLMRRRDGDGEDLENCATLAIQGEKTAKLLCPVRRLDEDDHDAYGEKIKTFCKDELQMNIDWWTVDVLQITPFSFSSTL